jgi:uncharacterized membrane protein
MNLAHIHLILNHFPVIGMVFGFLLLAFALVKKSEELIRVSLGVFIIIALLALPVYFTGEPAAKVIEHLPGVTESVVEEHEEAALITLITVEILGLVALGGLFYFRHLENLPNWLVKASLILAAISIGLLAWTANLGGKVRHTEIRSDFKPEVTSEKAAEDTQKEPESRK